MRTPKPIPLYPTLAELREMRLKDYAELSRFLHDAPRWRKASWVYVSEFLLFIGRNKSAHTYTRFRNEAERFLLWSFLFNEKSFIDYRKSDILAYADFCWQPPIPWICLANADRFTRPDTDGFYHTNPDWAPFRLQLPKHDKPENPDKRNYRPSQQSLKSSFTALSVMYKYMMAEEITQGNPVELARRDCRYFVADAQVKEVKRLAEEQWQYVLDTAIALADADRQYERNLFVIAALKTLFLRISELSERDEWSPQMKHFWEDERGNWWLKIYGG